MLLATAACNFSTAELQKVFRDRQFLSILTWQCVSRHSGVQFLISPLTTWLRTRRFNEPTFRLTWHANHWKNLAVRDFSNIWRGLSFFLLTFALLHLRSPDFISFHLFFICFSTLHILGSLLFKFLWIIGRQLRTCFLHMHSLSFSILSLDRTVLGFNSPTPQVPVGRTCQQQPLCVLFRCIRCYSGRLKFHFLGLWGLVGSQYIPRSYVLFSG